MLYIVLALVLLLLVAVAFLRLVRSHDTRVTDLDDLTGRTRAVDMEAFQNLIDPAETVFLKQQLQPALFRIVQRERILASTEYVRNIAHNAGLLIQLGQLARNHTDPQLAQAAHAMVERALRVRLMSMLVLVKLYSLSLIPALPFDAASIHRDYRNLTESAILFTRLQRPAFAGRVSAML